MNKKTSLVLYWRGFALEMYPQETDNVQNNDGRPKGMELSIPSNDLEGQLTTKKLDNLDAGLYELLLSSSVKEIDGLL